MAPQVDAKAHAEDGGRPEDDLAPVSRVVGTRLFQVELTPIPRLAALTEHCIANAAFSRARPLAHPGAVLESMCKKAAILALEEYRDAPPADLRIASRHLRQAHCELQAMK